MPGCGLGRASLGGVGSEGGVGGAAGFEGAGFTCPRNSTVGRRRTSRTSAMVSGAGSGGGTGDLASKLSGGIRTVYTGSPVEPDGGCVFSVFLLSGGSGRASVPTSRFGCGCDCAGGADFGDSSRARGNSHEQAAASARSDTICPSVRLAVPP